MSATRDTDTANTDHPRTKTDPRKSRKRKYREERGVLNTRLDTSLSASYEIASNSDEEPGIRPSDANPLSMVDRQDETQVNTVPENNESDIDSDQQLERTLRNSNEDARNTEDEAHKTSVQEQTRIVGDSQPDTESDVGTTCQHPTTLMIQRSCRSTMG